MKLGVQPSDFQVIWKTQKRCEADYATYSSWFILSRNERFRSNYGCNRMFVRRIADRSAKSLRIVVINIFILCFLLVLVEGFSSYVLFFRDVTATYPVAERLHTRYDSDLGWANTPNVQVEDIYGPGTFVKVNGQGFRNDYDFGVAVPASKCRYARRHLSTGI